MPQRAQARQLRSVEVRLLVARYLETGNMRQVARELGISRTTVAKKLAEQGIDTSVGMKPDDIHRAVDLYGQGLSSGKIGTILGFDNHTVLAGLRSAGVKIRPQSSNLAARSPREQAL